MTAAERKHRSGGVAALVALGLAVLCGPATAGAAALSGNVCPPFHLLDEEGDVIDPVKGANADRPYSPKLTCGKCHDYATITEGYHFMQGKGEKPTAA